MSEKPNEKLLSYGKIAYLAYRVGMQNKRDDVELKEFEQLEENEKNAFIESALSAIKVFNLESQLEGVISTYSNKLSELKK
jgi:hypothetical protein